MENKFIDPALFAFLDSCLLEKGIKDIPDELRAGMVVDLGEDLQKWLMQAVFMNLKEEDAPEMEKLIESGVDQNTLMEFLREKIENIDKIFEQEMLNFKTAYLGK